MGGNCFALFLGSQRSWKRPALQQEAAEKFREQCSLQGFDPAHILPHGSYLMNCGSPKEGLLKHGQISSMGSSSCPSFVGIRLYLLLFLICTFVQMCSRKAKTCWWMNSTDAACWVSTSLTSTLDHRWAPSPPISVVRR